MDGIERAQEALEAFALYAEQMEKNLPDYVYLRLYNDGSGSVIDRHSETRLLEFGTLEELLHKCQEALV
jgi:hypothetical protein